MSELIVLAFDHETGADEMREALVRLQKEYLITLEDAAVVVRKSDGRVKVRHAASLVGAGALGGAFWGLLIGVLFWAPWLGMAVGAATGAVSGKLTDIGIDDGFIKEVGNTVEMGHSALFLLVREVKEDKVVPYLAQFGAKVLRTSLSKEDEAKLRSAFGAEE